LPLDEPVAPPLPALLPEGGAGVVSGGMRGALVAPDFVPVEPVPSPDAAEQASGVAQSNPVSNSEVILMFIKATLLKLNSYLMVV
jgi:hypothetical protein